MICKRRPKRAYLRCTTLLLLFTFIRISSYAQLLDSRVSIDLGSGSLDGCVLQLQQATGFNFAYESSGLQSFPVLAKSFKKEKLSVILHYLLDNAGYVFEERHNVITIGPIQNAGDNHRPVYQFNGIIEDKETGSGLQGVAIYDPASKRYGTLTDQNGYFSLAAASDTLKVRLSYLSYEPLELELYASNALMIRIKMKVERQGLDSVLVSGPADISLVSPLRKESPSFDKMSFLPRFCGDVDLLTLLRTIPGINEAKDGSGALIVRGGAPDQNLLLIDGANIYGATHLFGLLSAVNANAVKEVNIYKGAFPARYGGKISSVWDISLKNGNPDKVHGILSLGTLASDFMLEGPLVKNKTTFLIAGRRSYHDLYARLFTPGLTFYFQDLNLKLRQVLSKKDQLYFTGYLSKDRFKLEEDSLYDDGVQVKQGIMLNTENQAAVLRWRHDYAADFSSNLYLTYSAYHLTSGNQATLVLPIDNGVTVKTEDRIRTGLYDLTAKLQTNYTPNDIHAFDAGIYYTRHTFNPYVFTSELVSSNLFFFPSGKAEGIIMDSTSNEAGFYLEDNINLSTALKASVGFHLNKYFYETKSYTSFQPRINLQYKLDNNWYLNASYVQMRQNLHMLSISQTSLPLDFWIPSTMLIKPQTSHQVNIGISGKLWDNLLDLSVTSYYKNMNNVAEYLVFGELDTTRKGFDWSQIVAVGKGTAYGIEFSLRKSKGNFNGWLSYTLSWSNRTLPEVNYGVTFPYKYDRRHNIGVVGVYKLGKSIELSAVFSFQSKQASPVLIIKSSDRSVEAEDFRKYAAITDLSTYHRLDIGINWIRKYKEDITGTWNLSVFNVYNKKNSFFFFSNNSNISGNSLLPISITLSYTLKF